MPETEPEIGKKRLPRTLNDAQQRRLSITCKYIDGLFCDIEHALHSPESESPFPAYAVDVTPVQARMIEGHIRSLRTQLLRALEWQHMKPEPPEIPLSRSVITNLGFVDIAIEELRPHHMRDCGAVPEDAISGLNHVVDELQSLLYRVSQSIRVNLGLDQNPQFSEPEKTGEEE